MSRLLLLIPSTSYRVSDFLAAAERVGVEVTVGSDEKQVLEEFSQGGTTTIDFKNIDVGTDQIIAFNRHYTVAAIIAVDEVTGVLAAKASDKLGLPHNDWTAIATTGNKLDMREKLAVAGLPSPKFQFFSTDDNPEKISHRIDYPCVLKPLNLSASRGVIRSNNSSEFVSAFNRIQRLLAEIGKTASDVVLVEDYIEGEEVALEGLLENGRLTTLALF
ncbi:MAG: ATP-grasp domain-containing protein, partial [Rhodospirillales bacterium]|nr:ATP-grasp domain-containing protein [Rhodospirillales bacterium]